MMTPRFALTQRGFSLAEMLIALALSSVIGVLLISIFIQNNSVSNNQLLKTSQALNNNNSFAKIGADIRQSSAIVSTYNAPPTYTTNDHTLVLQLPSLDNNGQIIASTYDYLVITPDSLKTNILRELVYPNALSSRPASNQVLTNALKSITFYYYDANQTPVSPLTASSVNFVINLNSASGNVTAQSSVSGQINLRNN